MPKSGHVCTNEDVVSRAHIGTRKQTRLGVVDPMLRDAGTTGVPLSRLELVVQHRQIDGQADTGASTRGVGIVFLEM